MRKLLWGGLAALAVGVGGTGYYACCHPYSIMGQCVIKLGELGLRANPIGLLARGAGNGTHQQNETVRQAPIDVSLPDEPVAVEDAAPDNALAGIMDVNPAVRIPPAITIVDDDIVPAEGRVPVPGVPMPDSDNMVRITSEPAVVVPANDEADHACPRVMPYADDDRDGKRMPYAGEKSDGEDLFDPESMHKLPGEGEESEPKPSETAPGAQPEASPAGGGATMESMSEYHHQHYPSQYMICPYSGKCVEITPASENESMSKEPEPEYELIPAPTPEEEEESAPKSATSFYGQTSKTTHWKIWTEDAEHNPPHPEVDTMEFRPSDDDSLADEGSGPD